MSTVPELGGEKALAQPIAFLALTIATTAVPLVRLKGLAVKVVI